MWVKAADRLLCSAAAGILYFVYQEQAPTVKVRGSCSYTSGGEHRTHDIKEMGDLLSYLGKMEAKRLERCSGTCTMQAKVVAYRSQKESEHTSEDEEERNYQVAITVDPPHDSRKSCDAYEDGVDKIRTFVRCMEEAPFQSTVKKCMEEKLR